MRIEQGHWANGRTVLELLYYIIYYITEKKNLNTIKDFYGNLNKKITLFSLFLSLISRSFRRPLQCNNWMKQWLWPSCKNDQHRIQKHFLLILSGLNQEQKTLHADVGISPVYENKVIPERSSQHATRKRHCMFNFVKEYFSRAI